MSSIEEQGFLSDEALKNKDIFYHNYKDLFDFASDLNKSSMELMRSIKLDWSDHPKIILNTLHLRLIENYQAVVMLLQLGMVSQAKTIVRGMLETVFILVALQKKPELLQCYFDQFEEGRKRALKASCQFKGEHLKKAAKDHKLEEHYVKHRNDLKGKTLNVLKPKQWALEAELEDFYNLWYTLYSNSSHSNIPALDDHFDKSEQELNMSFGPSDKYLCEVFQCCAYIMLNANHSMSEAFGIDRKAEHDKIFERIKEIDEKYLK